MFDFERVFQYYEGEITVVNDKTIDQFFCIMSRDEDTRELHPCLFWLKMLDEDCWYRFFIDVYCGWDIYPELDQSDFEFDPEDMPARDIGTILGLSGRKIASVNVREDPEHTITLRMVFSSGEEFRTWTSLNFHSGMRLLPGSDVLSGK